MTLRRSNILQPPLLTQKDPRNSPLTIFQPSQSVQKNCDETTIAEPDYPATTVCLLMS
jgi:hypothetical protein